MVFGKKAQVGIGPILVVVGILGLIISFTVFAIVTPVTNEFIEMGVNSSVEHNDVVTSFIISAIPVWIVIIFLAMLIYVIATGGGGY